MKVALKDATYDIADYNIASSDGIVFQLWGTRLNGKNVKLLENDEVNIREAKDFIDFAIKTDAQIVNLSDLQEQKSGE